MAEHSITYLTKKEAAKLLRCSTKTIDRRIKAGLIKVVEGTGGKYGQPRFDPSEIPALKKKFVYNNA